MNNMDWVEKMKTGMELIHFACKENTDWTKCKECPFTNYCDAINLAISQKTPKEEGWIEEGGATLTKPSMFGTDRFKIEVKERDSFCVKQCACGTCERKDNCICCDCDICEDFDCQVCFCHMYKEGD